MNTPDTPDRASIAAGVTSTRKRLPAPYRRQSDFARLVGRSVSTLSAYENGHRPVPGDFAATLVLLDALASAHRGDAGPTLLSILTRAAGAAHFAEL